jgi:hypothetical protein
LLVVLAILIVLVLAVGSAITKYCIFRNQKFRARRILATGISNLVQYDANLSIDQIPGVTDVAVLAPSRSELLLAWLMPNNMATR